MDAIDKNALFRLNDILMRLDVITFHEWHCLLFEVTSHG